MKQTRRKLTVVAAALLPLALLLAVALAAAGQVAGPEVAGETHSLLVPAADFVDDGLTAFGYAYHESGGYTYPVTDTFTCMQAPLYLPDGATVNSFGGYVYDDDPAGRVANIELRRVDYQPGPEAISDLLAEASTSSGDALDEVIFVVDDNVDFALVDNGRYVYYAVVCMNGGPGQALRLYAVEAAYSQ